MGTDHSLSFSLLESSLVTVPVPSYGFRLREWFSANVSASLPAPFDDVEAVRVRLEVYGKLVTSPHEDIYLAVDMKRNGTWDSSHSYPTADVNDFQYLNIVDSSLPLQAGSAWSLIFAAKKVQPNMPVYTPPRPKRYTDAYVMGGASTFNGGRTRFPSEFLTEKMSAIAKTPWC